MVQYGAVDVVIDVCQLWTQGCKGCLEAVEAAVAVEPAVEAAMGAVQ